MRTINDSATVLECHDLIKRFEGVRAVDGVSVSFAPGRVEALIGPNGAGKTTLFHLISGALRPDAGCIRYRGQRLDRLSAWRIARTGVGRLFQDVRIFGKMTVQENVLAAFPDQVGENLFHLLTRPGVVWRQECAHAEKARYWLSFVGLSDKASEAADALSYGQQKLLALARLLASGATVFLLDEPTAGVNPEMVSVLLALIKRLAEDGKTIVVIEHNMNVVAEIADRVHFIEAGRLTASGRPDEVLGDAQVRAAYTGV